MKIVKFSRYVSVESQRNKAKLVISKTNIYGVFGGIQFYENGDWWHLTFRLTFMCVYAALMFRWRIFGEGYDRKDVYDVYIE